MVGEIGLLLKQPRTATVVVSEDSVLYKLSLELYNRMIQDDLELAYYLYQWIGHVLSVRMTENSSTLEVLIG